MNTEISLTKQVHQTWNFLEKIAFRFFFLFLGLTSLFLYNVIAGLFNLISIPEEIMQIFNGPVAWIDKHFLNLGFVPDAQTSQFGDNYFGWILWITLFVLSVLGTIAWSLADRKRNNYNRLLYWFNFYLAYYIFQAMAMYAIRKIIPVQMPAPDFISLLMPVGNQTKFELLWNFIGVSPAYSIILGSCELVGALLILFRRTRLVGCLFMIPVLINVVLFNLLYNVPVKTGSTQLLLCTLFLLAPYLPRLFIFFFRLQPVSIAEERHTFTSNWKKYLMRALLVVPVWILYSNIESASEIVEANESEKKIYNVNTFVIENDTLPPLLTDSIRWKRLGFVSLEGNDQNFAVLFKMNDEMEQEFYGCIWDSTKKIVTIISEETGDSTALNYTEPSENELRLTGNWQGSNIDVLLDKFEIDSMNLVSEKVKWIQD